MHGCYPDGLVFVSALMRTKAHTLPSDLRTCAAADSVHQPMIRRMRTVPNLFLLHALCSGRGPLCGKRIRIDGLVV
jgi:hypothetical protein